MFNEENVSNILFYDHFIPKFATNRAPWLPHFDQNADDFAYKGQYKCHSTISS